MVERSFVALTERGILGIAGEDRQTFLQGLVSNDIVKVTPGRAAYAALLTAQGKYLHDFFIVAIGDAYYLDAEGARLADLRRRLDLYKLRSKVAVTVANERYSAAAAFGDGALAALGLPAERGTALPFAGGVAYADPRLADLGVRLLLPRGQDMAALAERGFGQKGTADYDRLRLALGVPDGSRDLAVEKSILLESGFDELGGIDWQKGCYVGQELTARTKYRGLIKKRLVPVTVEGPLPVPGTPVMWGDDEAGEMRSGRDGMGLALLRIDAIRGAEAGKPLTAATARLTPSIPSWAEF